MSEQFSTFEEALIARLQRAPQPELSAEARAAIHARLLSALDNPPAPLSRPALPRPIIVTLVVVVITAALITGVVLFVVSRQSQPEIIPTLPTPVTMTPLPPPSIPAVIISPVLTEMPQPSATPEATVTSTTAATPSISSITVIEGPVENITGRTITIYGIQIQLAVDDPVLAAIVVGDILRVEGSNQTIANQVVIVEATIVVNTVEVNVSPSSGEIWRDNGSCANPPPDWAPAHGWRKRCEGKEKDNGKENKQEHDKDDD